MTGIYARQSVEKKDSMSIEGQIDLCKLECHGDDPLIFQDKGFSGKNTLRPAFKRMLEEVRAGRIQKIVVYRLDRFSRSIADFGRIWEVLQEKDVEFVSVNEKFDTSTPMGRAMLHIIMVFAQLERETIAERVRDNYHQRAQRGEWTGGSAPYGFDIGRLTDAATGKKSPTLVPNAQAAAVRRIFTEYALTEPTLGSLAQALNGEGIPCMKRKCWDSVSVSRVLHNPVYVQADERVRLYFQGAGIGNLPPIEAFDGQMACLLTGRRDTGKTRYTLPEEQTLLPMNHAGIVSSELWLECQQKLSHNRQIKNSGKGKHTWLSGLLKCATCGYALKVGTYKDTYYLICSGRTNLKICQQKITLTLAEIEQAVTSEILAMFADCHAEEPNSGSDRLQRDLQALDEKIGRLIHALADGSSVSMKYINAELQRLDQQKQALLQQLNIPPKKPLREQFSGVRFDLLYFEQKKLVAFGVVNRILVGDDSVEIIWKI